MSFNARLGASRAHRQRPLGKPQHRPSSRSSVFQEDAQPKLGLLKIVRSPIGEAILCTSTIFQRTFVPLCTKALAFHGTLSAWRCATAKVSSYLTYQQIDAHLLSLGQQRRLLKPALSGDRDSQWYVSVDLEGLLWFPFRRYSKSP